MGAELALIGLAGRAGAGKDEVARILTDFGFERRAFADKLRAVAYAADPHVQGRLSNGGWERLSTLVDEVGWDRAKQFGDVRRFLQRLGTEGVRAHLGYDTWVEAIDLDATRIAIADVRFENEAEFVRSRGGVVWRVLRDAAGAVAEHVSEDQSFPADAVLVNNGTLAELRVQVATLARAELTVR